MKTTKWRLLSIGALLLLLGAIGSNANIIFSGIGGWLLMLAGVIVLIVGFTKKDENNDASGPNKI